MPAEGGYQSAAANSTATVPVWRIFTRVLAPLALWILPVIFIPVVFSFVAIASDKVTPIVFAAAENGAAAGGGPETLYELLVWGAALSSFFLSAMSKVFNLTDTEWRETLFRAGVGVLAGFGILLAMLIFGQPTYRVWTWLFVGAAALPAASIVIRRFS